MEEEISQEEEEKDNIHELMVIIVATQEPTTKIEAGPKENDEQNPVEIIATTQELVVKMVLTKKIKKLR